MTILAPHRQQARDPGHARLTPRDLSLVLFARDAQPVPTSAFLALSGISRDMLHRRLRVLRDLGVLRVEVTALERENLYQLAPGARPVLERLGLDGEVPRALPRQLEHHVPAVHLHACLRRALAKSARFERESFVFLHERELRRRLATAPGVTFPDAALRITAVTGETRAVAVEVDTGTENPSYVVRKFEAYARLREAGVPLLGEARWSVLVLTPSGGTRRLHRLASAAWTAEVPDHLVYYLGLPLDPDTVLRPDGCLTPLPGPDADGTLAAASPFTGAAPAGAQP